MCIFGKLKQRLAEAQEKRNGYIDFCLEGTELSHKNLTPLSKEEYEAVLNLLKNHVTSIPKEPEMIYTDWKLPNGQIIHYPSRNIFAWKEIADCMEHRVKEAYRLNREFPCPHCNKDNIICIHFRSNAKSWRNLCGREGYMLICPDCMSVLWFKHFLMN